MPPVDPLTGMRASRFGLYIHFPYCLSRCPYCDFAVTIAKVTPEERYAKAVVRELALRRSADEAPRALDSIFFGGGTPSLWSPRWVAHVLDAVAGAYALADDVEISLEANPEATDLERWRGLRQAGVNRLSLGVQSFDGEVLRALGRQHDAAKARLAVAQARAAGFDNLSIDLIFGAQGQTVAQARRDAEEVVALSPEHVSAYTLTLERESLAVEVPLARQLRRGEVTLPREEEIVAMGNALREALTPAGYARYEVSNYAKPGFQSRHNALYWTGGEYQALGAGAVGMLCGGPREGSRFFNHRSAEKYLAAVEAGRLPESEREALDAQALFTERLSMGLRLASGVDLRALCEAFDQRYAAREPKIEILLAHGLARWVEGRLCLTEAGLDVHSAAAASLL